MADEIRNLWPDVIVTKVASPVAILRYQASQLRKQTQGLLEAEVKTYSTKDHRVLHEFRIIAPALDGLEYLLFSAWHEKAFVYPVSIQFEPWVEQSNREYTEKKHGSMIARLGHVDIDPERPTGIRQVATPTSFLAVLEELLKSHHTQSVLMSLIAKINDADGSEGERPDPSEVPARPSPPQGDSPEVHTELPKPPAESEQ
jgi:hypothetical protein